MNKKILVTYSEWPALKYNGRADFSRAKTTPTKRKAYQPVPSTCMPNRALPWCARKAEVLPKLFCAWRAHSQRRWNGGTRADKGRKITLNPKTSVMFFIICLSFLCFWVLVSNHGRSVARIFSEVHTILQIPLPLNSPTCALFHCLIYRFSQG